MDQVNVKCHDFGDEWGFYIDIESINNENDNYSKMMHKIKKQDLKLKNKYNYASYNEEIKNGSNQNNTNTSIIRNMLIRISSATLATIAVTSYIIYIAL